MKRGTNLKLGLPDVLGVGSWNVLLIWRWDSQMSLVLAGETCYKPEGGTPRCPLCWQAAGTGRRRSCTWTVLGRSSSGQTWTPSRQTLHQRLSGIINLSKRGWQHYKNQTINRHTLKHGLLFIIGNKEKKTSLIDKRPFRINENSKWLTSDFTRVCIVYDLRYQSFVAIYPS